MQWHELVVEYRGGQRIGPVTMRCEPGRVLGLVGANGAGKTTLLKAACGLVRACSGSVRVGSDVVQPGVMPAGVGAMIEEPRFLDGASAWRNLSLAAAGRPDRLGRRRSVLGEVGLGGKDKQTVGGFSQGMRQRLGIARLLLGDPPVIILDEPTNGLDPEGIRWIRTTVRKLSAAGRSVILSSHLLAEVQVLADDIAVVAAGQVVAFGPALDVLSAQQTLEQFYFEHLAATTIDSTARDDGPARS